jgi:hypothetical protein
MICIKICYSALTICLGYHKLMAVAQAYKYTPPTAAATDCAKLLARPATVPLLAWLGPATVAPSCITAVLLVEGTEFPDTFAVIEVAPERADEPPFSSLP